MKVTNAELAKTLKDFLGAQVAALDGILASVPETLQAKFKALKESFSEQLSKIPSAEQLGDNDTAAALFSASIVKAQDFAKELMSGVATLQKELGAQVTAHNELKEKLAKGDLIEKAKVTELCSLAKQEGVDSMKPEIAETRKMVLETARLPVPDEKVLNLPATEFNALHADAVKNIEAAKGKGLSLGGKGAGLLKGIIWNKVEAFNGEMTKIEDLIGKTHTPDPLLGGGGDGKEADFMVGVG